MFADVGVGAGALGGCSEAVPSGESGLDDRSVAPFSVVVASAGASCGVGGDGDHGLSGGCGHRPDTCLGEGERTLVFGSDGGVEEMRVAQAHLGGHVPEERHQGLERDTGVDERGCVGVAELVWGDVSDPGGLCAAGEFFADSGLGEPPAVVGEEKLCRPFGARVWERPSGAACCGDAVDEGDGFVVERNHAFGVELAERDFQPRAVPDDLVDTIEFEIQEFTDA